MPTNLTNMEICFRAGLGSDADCLGVLAAQVFLDTYATEGIRRAIAREVIADYSPEAFSKLLSEPSRQFILAEQDSCLVGFAEIAAGQYCPVESSKSSFELARLYIQKPFQRLGVGRRLLEEVETALISQDSNSYWLSVWSGNDNAKAFYNSVGFLEIGSVKHVIEGSAYENRVLIKSLPNGKYRIR